MTAKEKAQAQKEANEKRWGQPGSPMRKELQQLLDEIKEREERVIKMLGITEEEINDSPTVDLWNDDYSEAREALQERQLFVHLCVMDDFIAQEDEQNQDDD